MNEKKNEIDVLKLSVVLAIAISIFNLSDMFFKFVTWDFYNTPLYSMKLAMLLSAILFTTVLAFTKKTWKATLVSYIIVFIITIINEIKINIKSTKNCICTIKISQQKHPIQRTRQKE